MDEYLSYVEYQKRPNHVVKPAVVTEELFDLITKGDTKSPLFLTGTPAVPVFDVSRKEEAEEIYYSKKQTQTVIVR